MEFYVLICSLLSSQEMIYKAKSAAVLSVH